MLFLPIFRVMLISLISVWASASLAEETTHVLPRQILLEKPVELASTKLQTRMVRVIFPKGYKTPLHTHEGPGPRYVVKGKIKIEEGGQIHEYGPGEVFWESGQWMTAENVSNEEAELIIVELITPK